MKPTEFLNQLQHNTIVRAIGDAESKMHGEIRVFISRKEPVDAVVAARKAFDHLHMEKTSLRNAVLLFVAPKVRKFAIIGDQAVHARCGDDFWKEVAEEMAGYFRRSEFTEGILHGVQRAGKLLAEHFPRTGGGRNEQPDEIAHD